MKWLFSVKNWILSIHNTDFFRYEETIMASLEYLFGNTVQVLKIFIA